MAYDNESIGLSALTISRLLETADYLESLPPKNFNMRYWIRPDPECGTVACIGGHIVLKNKLNRRDFSGCYIKTSLNWLGIDVTYEEYLEKYFTAFVPDGNIQDMLPLCYATLLLQEK